MSRPGGKTSVIVYYLAAALLVGVDQLTKALVRESIPLGEQAPLIPGVLGLTYVQNTGMAFSAFSAFTGALAALSFAVSVVLALAIARDYFHSSAARWFLTLVLAGAVGNLLDRAFLGYVTDMIQVLLFRFAVFNVADCCICVGIALLAVYLLFFDREGKEQKQ